MIKYKIRVQSSPWLKGYEVWVLKEDFRAGLGSEDFVLNQESEQHTYKFSKYGRNDYNLPCTFSLERGDVQKLMDDLWNAGIRPTDAGDSAGALTATKAHLEDMRKLVFNKNEPLEMETI